MMLSNTRTRPAVAAVADRGPTASSITSAIRRSGVRAFTLLEVLLALALVSLMLIAMNSFVFSMGELWGVGTDKRHFDQHAVAVTRFLQSELRAALLPPAVQPNATDALTAPEVRTQSGTADNMLTFTLPTGSRMITWPEGRPLPDVVCSLQVRAGEGLMLLWHSTLETKFNEDPPRETLISPLVTELQYLYYDSNLRTWTAEKELKKDTNGLPEIPQRLQLKFVHDDYTRDSVITLPVAGEGLPNF